MDRYALFGDPIARSPSPAMHNAAFAELGIPARYELRPTPAADATSALNEVRSGVWRGANVTTPLKTVLGAAVPLRGLAARGRAVNTLVWENGTLVGHLTDVEGVTEPLHARLTSAPTGVAIVLGAGGAARAAALACESLGLPVIIAARDAAKAADLVQAVGIKSSSAFVFNDAGLPWSQAAVLVQSTPVGKSGDVLPVPWDRVPKHAVAFEMLYLPRRTPFLVAAEARGCATIEGWEMLLAQGARSFSLWTGQGAPLDVMRAAVLSHLTAA